LSFSVERPLSSLLVAHRFFLTRATTLLFRESCVLGPP
jgi:hypothetical protein